MSTKTLEIGNIEIDVVRKDISRMHLAVYPPHGRVRLAVPDKTDEEIYRLFAISKLRWIKKHVKNFQSQARETQRDYVNGESHYYQGMRYILEVVSSDEKQVVELKGNQLILFCKSNSDREQKAEILKEWYRKQLKSQIESIIPKWEKTIGVKCESWGVRQMRTKWGSCNTDKKSILLNLELVKKPKVCLEYILVHELVHLHERNHNTRFITLMNQFLPNWRLYRDELNSLPIVHNDWGY